LEQTAIHISTPRHRSHCQRQRSLGYRQYTHGLYHATRAIYWQRSSFIISNWKFKPPIAYDRDSCSPYTRPKECKNVDAFAANVSLTTSLPGFIREDGRLNVQLRSISPSATTNYVAFISCSEFGSEPRRRTLSMQSERVTHLHIETIHKTLWIPLGYPRVNKKHSKI